MSAFLWLLILCGAASYALYGYATVQQVWPALRRECNADWVFICIALGQIIAWPWVNVETER